MDSEKQELKELEKDNAIFEIKNSAFQSELSRQLINGLGDEILKTITNPIKISKFKLFKHKITNLINKIAEVL